MKVVFLDIDGVMNFDGFLESNPQEGFDPEDDGFWRALIAPQCVERLNRIVATTDAVVVVSSTWRRLLNNERIARILSSLGFVGSVVGSIAKDGSSRGAKILAWLDSHKEAVSFVVLDDDISGVLRVTQNLVFVDHKVGLTDQDVGRAIEILETVC